MRINHPLLTIEKGHKETKQYLKIDYTQLLNCLNQTLFELPF